MFEYRMEYLFSYSATLTPPEVIGPVPEGIRANFYVTGGSADGPKLRGTLLPVGGDWLTLRRDGIAVLDVKATLRTHDDALIDLAYSGVGDLGVDGYERFVRGELPAKMALRTGPRFRSAHPDYQWLNRLHCVGVGEVQFDRSEVSYDVYAVR